MGILTLSCGGGERSPVCDLVPAVAQTPEGHSNSVVGSSCHYSRDSVYSASVESQHLGQGTEAGMSGFRAGQGTCVAQLPAVSLKLASSRMSCQGLSTT